MAFARVPTAAEVLAELVQEKFSTFPRSLLSLVQFASGDNLSELYYPLLIARPQLALIFIPLLILVTVGLMSLVPAILVENQGKEKERREIEGQHMFRRVTKELKQKLPGADRSREIKRGHLGAADINESAEIKELDTVDFDFGELFDILASKLCPKEEDPSLGVDEFLHAVIESFVFETPLSTIETLAHLRRLSSRMGRVEANQQKFQESMQSTQKILESLRKTVDGIREAPMNRSLKDVESSEAETLEV